MSHRSLAALAVPAALILPVTMPGVADAAPTALVAYVAPTVAHRRHLTHLHHLHVLHARVAAAERLAGSVRQRILKAAEGYLGQPYVYGSLDCSSLTQHAYAAVGIRLPRTAAAQGRVARRVRTPHVADLVIYGDPATHVGIYVKRGLMIVARHAGTRIQFEAIYGAPHYGTMLT